MVYGFWAKKFSENIFWFAIKQYRTVFRLATETRILLLRFLSLMKVKPAFYRL